jgi:hypothetical protein
MTLLFDQGRSQHMTVLSATSPPPLEYPESDGLPVADNSRQMLWIVIFYNNLEILFGGRPDVLVGGNLMWCPVEGEDETRAERCL